MKRILPLFLGLIVTIASCKSDYTESDELSESETVELTGKFVRVGNNDRAGIEKYVTIIQEIEFKGSHCHFKYMGTPMSGKYEVDQNFVYITTGGELGMLSLEIIDNNQLEGEGFIHGTFKREGTYKPDVISEKKSKPKTKSSNNPFEGNQDNLRTEEEPLEESPSVSDEFNSNPSQSDNPFGFGSGGGTGDGVGFGAGDGGLDASDIGQDPSRKRISNVNITDLQYNSDEIITLKLVIDSEGNVVRVWNVKSQTTTTDQILINKIISAVKKQVKYTKKPDAPLATSYYKIKINAQ